MTDAVTDTVTDAMTESVTTEPGPDGSRIETGDVAAGDSQPEVNDCLPSCIADVRRGCRFPLAAGGSCISDGQANMICFSNGVRQIDFPSVDAGPGYDIEVTMSDGTTPCYYMNITIDQDASAYADTVTYFSVSGSAAGSIRRMLLDGGVDPNTTATCPDGHEYPVNLNGPGCDGRLTTGQCGSGNCK